MLLQIQDALTGADLEAVAEVAAQPDLFVDGAATAGWRAAERKRNRQGDGSPMIKGALKKVLRGLDENALFQSAARPKAIASLLMSRYEPGMAYGAHVDDAMMAGRRTDLSFTLFLSDPAAYEGGALVIDRPEGEAAFRLPAGSMVLYPSTALHWVAPVERGVRRAVVGWVRSLVREAERREALFDLDQAAAALRGGGNPERALDLLLKTRSNLMRAWVDD